MTYPPQPQPWRPPPPPKRGLSSNAIIALAIGIPLVLVMLCALGIFGARMSAKNAASPGAAPAVADADTTAARRPPTAAAPSSAPPIVVKMPNLVGKNAAVAGDELEKLGFTNVTFGSVDPNDTVVILPANWRVAEQSTPAGTDVSTDTLIVLGCTKKR